jgi:hypothetical protein
MLTFKSYDDFKLYCFEIYQSVDPEMLGARLAEYCLIEIAGREFSSILEALDFSLIES